MRILIQLLHNSIKSHRLRLTLCSGLTVQRLTVITATALFLLNQWIFYIPILRDHRTESRQRKVTGAGEKQFCG